MTVTTIRTGHLNRYLGITTDGDAIPWTTADRDAYIVDALSQCWPDIGLRATGSVATSQATDLYTLPGSIALLSRIELRRTSGGVANRIDRAVAWNVVSDTQVQIQPLLPTDATLLLHFYGWKPFAVDASDIPLRLERVIAMRAAALAYSAEASQMGNYKRQQGTDNARVVDYATLVGLSALWERRYFEQIDKDPTRLSMASRAARR